MEGEPQTQYKEKGAQDAFLNLLALITLGWMSISLGRVLFLIIDKLFNPDFLSVFSQGNLAFSIASLLIITPIYLLIIGYIHQQYNHRNLNPNSGIYRWLTYLMLLISALNIIGSLIAVIYQLLDGSYTLASLLKILTIFIIAGGIFGYYWYDLHRHDYSQQSFISKMALTIVIILVAVAIVGSLFMVDSPRVARMKKADQQRVEDLSQISYIINSHYINNNELPADLSENKFSNFTDPVTKKPYGYKIKSHDSYELCAVFEMPADNNDEKYYGGEDWYFHKAGEECFTKSVKNKEDLPQPIMER